MPDLILVNRETDLDAGDQPIPGESLVAERIMSDIRLRERDGVRSLLRTEVRYERGISTAGKPFRTSRLTLIERLVSTKGGYLVLSGRQRGVWVTMGRVFSDVHPGGMVIGDYREMLDEHFDLIGLDQFAPLYRHYHVPSRLFTEIATDPGFVKAFAGCTTAAQLTASLFGSKRVRADLVKAVAQASWQRLFLAWALRGPEVPTDWLVSFLRNDFDPQTQFQEMFVRDWVRHLDRKSRRRLLLETGQDARSRDEAWSLRDLAEARAPKGTCITSASSWADLHRQQIVITTANLQAKRDAAVRREWTKIRRSDALRRRYDADYQAFLATPEGQAMLAAQQAEQAEWERAEKAAAAEKRRRATELGESIVSAFADSPYRVEFSHERAVLGEWGQRMSNCIAGYSSEAEGGRALLLGIFEGDQLVANAEIGPTSEPPALRQLLGRFNRTFPGHRDVAARLSELGIDTDSYWGDERR